MSATVDSTAPAASAEGSSSGEAPVVSAGVRRADAGAGAGAGAGGDAADAGAAIAAAVTDAGGSFDEAQLEDGFTPKTNTPYTTQEYWDYRFKKEESYDWLAKYDDIAPVAIDGVVKPTHRILTLGCGNSTFSGDLYAHGFTDIVNTDFAPSVIERQREAHKDATSMTWEVMDMRKLSFPDNSFDVVIDKAGMDAILADGGDVWEPPEELLVAADEVCRGVQRILKPGGVFVQVSFSQPHFRKLYIDREEYPWIMVTKTVDTGFGYFAYIATMPS